MKMKTSKATIRNQDSNRQDTLTPAARILMQREKPDAIEDQETCLKEGTC
jgi:hypothetical protein